MLGKVKDHMRMTNDSAGMYRHYIFDIDGTLIDTERTGVLSLMKTVRELLGQEMPYGEAYRYFGIPSGKVAPMLGFADNELFANRWEENFVELQYLMKPFDGVQDVLTHLKETGKWIGCVTSRNRYEFSKDIHLQKMAHLFDAAICAEDTARHKPDPEPVLEYMRRMEQRTGERVLPEECLYLGDTVHDFECASGAGCDFALADWHVRGMQGIPAKYRFSTAEELLGITAL